VRTQISDPNSLLRLNMPPTSVGRVYDAPVIQGDVTGIDYNADGSTVVTTADRAGTQPWYTHTVLTNAAGNIEADNYSYGSALSTFFNSHSISGIGAGSWDESTAASFVASAERALYLGDAADGGVEGIFIDTGPFRSFSTGQYDIDVQSGSFNPNAPGVFGTGLTVIEPSFAFDASSYDAAFQNWDWQTAGNAAFETSTFDGWSYGTVWEPIILDLNGDGVRIIARDNSNAEFDVDGDGFDEHAAWVGAGDGLLVLNNPTNDLASWLPSATRSPSRRRPA
jgi:hypothetical protein